MAFIHWHGFSSKESFIDLAMFDPDEDVVEVKKVADLEGCEGMLFSGPEPDIEVLEQAAAQGMTVRQV